MQFISLIMIVLLATPAAAGSGSAQLGETHSALELMTACQAPAEDLSSRAFCRGFVTAAYDGIQFYMRAQSQSEGIRLDQGFQVCSDEAVRSETLISTVVAFAERNPDALRLTAFSFAQMAMVGTYPCRT
jgi:hypothetical protein|tara:strand:+ start:398 stop:787 length:390 start_codon:yes stop_codon:yes gene_type:complete